MKKLILNRFPFVELPNDQLTKEQLKIKNEYNRLREVHADDKRVGGKPDRR